MLKKIYVLFLLLILLLFYKNIVAKNIEMVFLGTSISDNEKYKEARLFISKHKIVQVDIQKMRAKTYRNKHSNLCSVLDEYLIEK